MKTKKCTKCEVEFEVSSEFFHKNVNTKDGFSCRCKPCLLKQKKDYHNKNKALLNERCRKQYKKHRAKRLEYKRWEYQNKKDEIKERNSQQYLKNRDARIEYQKQYYKSNKDTCIERGRKYIVNKYHSDPNLKIKMNLSRRMRGLFSKNGNRTVDFIGCSIDDLKLHLEKQFVDGMSWKNYGRHGWHVDHIRPCCSFDLTDSEQVRECFHYSNLQPLWAKDNLSKGGNYEFPLGDE